ncbi:hypothetical protein LRX75_00440 [Rhizobium sp. DKSPLA3]|uniref:Uncharacterized protein n=1 Tax=Rhizobium quercicola TaxID=2901226 RepID=A0A9X1NPS2_9HYPH|nr:hypothetical protein [Rhizobium quercicola]MCD7107494.1 hypothetical protein [Rhizobium quercicola]
MIHHSEKQAAFIMGVAGLGVMLATAGVARIAAHLQTTEAFLGAICGGSADASGSILANAVHCWGCPAAALGLGLMVSAIVAAGQRPAGARLLQAAR